MEYTKKAVTIEAFKMTVERREDNSEWPAWLSQAWQKEVDEEGCLYFLSDKGSKGGLMIKTLEGNQLVSVDDYIIQGVKGEIYPCKPDIFELTYDLAKDKKELTFGMALEAMKQGKKAARSGWNGKNMYAVIMPGYPDGIEVNDTTRKAHNLPEGTVLVYRPYFQLFTAQSDVAMWSPSGSDALAEDWMILE